MFDQIEKHGSGAFYFLIPPVRDRHQLLFAIDQVGFTGSSFLPFFLFFSDGLFFFFFFFSPSVLSPSLFPLLLLSSLVHLNCIIFDACLVFSGNSSLRSTQGYILRSPDRLVRVVGTFPPSFIITTALAHCPGIHC